MDKLNIYELYHHPIREYVIMEKSLDIYAYLLGPFWFCYKRMWTIGVGVLVASFIIISFIKGNLVVQMMLCAAVFLLCGFNFDFLYQRHLRNHGYKYIKMYSAPSLDQAVLDFNREFQQYSTECLNESELRKCPYCAETIKMDAIYCKHCQQSLIGR